MTLTDDGLEILSAEECHDLLGRGTIGRVAVTVAALPAIFPVNYALLDGRIVFRTGEGTKLDGALSGNPVVFEVDGLDPESKRAWSAVVKGEAGMPESTQDIVETLELPIFPWQGGIKSRYVRIRPDEVTGRRFRVQAGGAATPRR
jgi:nitroimidazol reductase NimA-like FMN-containing flavoprotein (pyridoxamine 5'-phosphate oxidase superfamily)